jgi:hypothetical protein
VSVGLRGFERTGLGSPTMLKLDHKDASPRDQLIHSLMNLVLRFVR